jgi:hypothetical protein
MNSLNGVTSFGEAAGLPQFSSEAAVGVIDEIGNCARDIIMPLLRPSSAGIMCLRNLPPSRLAARAGVCVGVRIKPASIHPVDLKGCVPFSLSVPIQVLRHAIGLIVELSLRKPQQFIQQVTEPRRLFREPYLSLFDRQRSG